MSAEQTPAILSWIKEVARSVRKSPPNTHRFKKSVGNRTSPPLTPASKHKRKRSVPGAENLISQSDPSKRTRHPAFGTPDDIISLAISSPTTSQGERARPSSPSRVKAELAAASPRVVYIHESADPTSLAASQLLAILTQDSEFHDIHDVARKVSNASCQCAFELRSKGSWVNKVALPLLEGAIGELPLKCWSVPRYIQPQNRFGGWLPVNDWEAEYERAGLHTAGKSFSHMTYPYTGKRVLGPGVEIKAADGNLVEAQVQIGVWMTGLLMWAFEQRKTTQDLPPLVGCTAVGEDWKFYIAIGVEGSGVLKEVRIWGPLSDLDGRTTSVKHTTSLLKILRRVMEYTVGQ
ncbi:hypothetical protein HAV15_003422 [Penicillium sp. str. |nr:hypothetical protein HAV15_003422 [Penicillium sp. str. \